MLCCSGEHYRAIMALLFDVCVFCCCCFFFFFVFFSEKIGLNISCELSVGQTIHMTCQSLFSLKNSNKN